MAVVPTPATASSPPYAASQPDIAALNIPAPRAQPLWRFAAIGLGPLGLMLLFAFAVEISRRLA